MANVHILTKADNEVRVAMHFTVPAGNNAVGVPWVTALVNSGLASVSILKDGDGTAGTIAATEKAQLAAGTLYELVTTLRPQTAPSGAANLNAYLDNAFTAAQTDTFNRLQEILRYFGAVR